MLREPCAAGRIFPASASIEAAMQTRLAAQARSAGIDESVAAELTFLAEWESGIARSLLAYLRIRQLRQANLDFLMPHSPAK